MKTDSVFSLDQEQNFFNERKAEWLATKNRPFSHIILDNFLDPCIAEKCADEISGLDSSQFLRYGEPYFEFEKYTLNDTSKFPPTLLRVFQQLHSPQMLGFLENLTEFSKLHVDEQRWGAGIHQTKKGGYLAVHKDFSVLPPSFKNALQKRRVLNIIGYLTRDWDEGAGGELELWDSKGTGPVNKIPPLFNRWVIFDTRNSYHGHPYPYQSSSPRTSLATYYYVEEVVPPSEWRSTEYLKLPWKADSEEYQLKRLERADFRNRYKNFLP
jgi:Rps23 Pro-64 3,4-dihydroxylase Tpa1-like proline 4-hydroxylase